MRAWPPFFRIFFLPASLLGSRSLRKLLASRGPPFCFDCFLLLLLIVYVCVCICVHLCKRAYVEARDNPWSMFFRSLSPWVLRQSPSLTGVPGHHVPRIHLSTPRWAWDYKHSPPCLAIKHRFSGLNSSLLACTLQTDQSSHPQRTPFPNCLAEDRSQSPPSLWELVCSTPHFRVSISEPGSLCFLLLPPSLSTAAAGVRFMCVPLGFL